MPLAGFPLAPRGHVADMPAPKQPVTDDTIQVRQLSHYQFSWVAGDPGEEGTFTLQLVLDQGAWEEVVTVDAEDAEVLQGLLKRSQNVVYDVARGPSSSERLPSGPSRRRARARAGPRSATPCDRWPPSACR